MKIAIIISSLKFGGAEKQAIVDAELLAKDHQVLFIAFQDGPLREQLPKSVEFIQLKKTNYFSTAKKLVEITKSKKIDVIHAHLFAPMVISSIATLLGGAPVIWNFHSHAYGDGKSVKLVHGLVSKLSGVKKILFPANELREYYQSEKFNFPQNKEMIFFNSGQFQDRQSYNTPEVEEVIIGFVGRIVPLKRVHLLVQLAYELKLDGISNFKISIVGDGPTLPEIKAEAKRKGVQDLINFHGFQSDTHKYYKRFSIFTLPSEEEVLSLSLIDAQLIGLPCVAFNVGGNADVIENGKSGFIVENERAFMDRLKELILDKELRQKMGRRAIDQSTDKFSQKARAENLENLYKSIVSA